MRIIPHKDFLIDFYSEEQKSTINSFIEELGLIIKGTKDSVNIRKADLKSILHPYEIPKMVTFISSFERTINGKLDRKKTASKINKSAWQILL